MPTDPNVPKHPINPRDPYHGDSTEAGYERSDVSVKPIAVFVTSLFIFVLVFFVVCFGMGKVINNLIAKQDGPPNYWNQAAGVPDKRLHNMESNPAMQQQELQQLTQRFPTPRLQMDDGNQDLADLHIREDLLLDHYSWIDHGQGKMRVPIERAMELIAQRGLPVAPASTSSTPLLTGDFVPQVQTPLTNGFTRTGYEQEQESSAKTTSNEGSANTAP